MFAAHLDLLIRALVLSNRWKRVNIDTIHSHELEIRPVEWCKTRKSCQSGVGHRHAPARLVSNRYLLLQ